MDQFSYYMIRVRYSPAESPHEPLTGVVERIGSGEKESFADGAELLRLLGAWPYRLPNMRVVTERGKT